MRVYEIAKDFLLALRVVYEPLSDAVEMPMPVILAIPMGVPPSSLAPLLNYALGVKHYPIPTRFSYVWIYPETKHVLLGMVESDLGFAKRLFEARIYLLMCEHLFGCDTDAFKEASEKLDRERHEELSRIITTVETRCEKIAFKLRDRYFKRMVLLNQLIDTVYDYVSLMVTYASRRPEKLEAVLMDAPLTTLHKLATYIAPIFRHVWRKIKYKVMKWIDTEVVKVYEPYL